jgi:hypothetical protein
LPENGKIAGARLAKAEKARGACNDCRDWEKYSKEGAVTNQENKKKR